MAWMVVDRQEVAISWLNLAFQSNAKARANFKAVK
jgi:hypothetical protein